MNFSKNKIHVALILLIELVLPCAVSGSDQHPGDNINNGFFISEIFNKYGANNFITYEGFEHLLENLGLGRLKFDSNHDVSLHRINGTFVEIHDELFLHRHDYESAEKSIENESAETERKKRNITPHQKDAILSIKQQCLSPQDILITFGLEPHHDVISKEKYLQICPAIIYELDQKLCQEVKGEEEDLLVFAEEPKDYRLVWLYASVSTIVMGVSGMLCVLVVPIVGTDAKSPLLQFLIAVAAGTLCGDSLIHLLPQVLSKMENESNESKLVSTSKGTSALFAIFFFFIIENILKKCKNQKKKASIKEISTMLSDAEAEEVHHMGHNHCNDDIKSVAWMAMLGDILHNVTDGLSIGAAFTTSLPAGFASSIAIFCHELPHEMGDYAIFLASGMSIKKALFYNVLSSVFSFFGMVAGILLGEFENASLWINSITAGSFLYVALSDLAPEMKKMAYESTVKCFLLQMIGFFCGGTLMFGIAVYEDEIEAILC